MLNCYLSIHLTGIINKGKRFPKFRETLYQGGLSLFTELLIILLIMAIYKYILIKMMDLIEGNDRFIENPAYHPPLIRLQRVMK